MIDLSTQRAAHWRERLSKRTRRIEQTPPPPVEGSLTRMVGLTLEATGCQASIGDYCDVITRDGSRVASAVFVSAGHPLSLRPAGDIQGRAPSARVIPRQRGAGTVRVGPQLLGRIVD